jgi:ATP-dependent helicase IRC3
VVSRGARGKRWEVAIDERIMARFSTLEDAVQAVDYEIDRKGRAASASARHEAAWRHAPAPPDLLSRLRDQDRVTTHAEALQLLVWRTLTHR